MSWNGMMGGGMFLWWFFIIIAIIGLASYFGHRGGTGSEKSAADILKERFARGEISKQEFEEKKKDIA